MHTFETERRRSSQPIDNFPERCQPSQEIVLLRSSSSVWFNSFSSFCVCWLQMLFLGLHDPPPSLWTLCRTTCSQTNFAG